MGKRVVTIGPDIQGRRVATSTAHYRAIVRKFLFREGLIRLAS
jgi:hypothetical protein